MGFPKPSMAKRTFLLKNIDPHTIKTTYGLLIVSNLQKTRGMDVSKTTRIENVIAMEEHGVSFLDEHKKEVKGVATMVSWMNGEKMPCKTDLHCFWCHHEFASCPIGCPVAYVNPLVEKSYTSHITKDRYYMRENVTREKLEWLLSKSTSSSGSGSGSGMDVRAFPNHFYITDGVFCSFNCVLAFIESKPNDPFYQESYHLIHGMYEECVGKKFTQCKLTPAPDWRLLRVYGGHLSIEEFRRAFNHVTYESWLTLTDMRALSRVYKEK